MTERDGSNIIESAQGFLNKPRTLIAHISSLIAMTLIPSSILSFYAGYRLAVYGVDGVTLIELIIFGLAVAAIYKLSRKKYDLFMAALERLHKKSQSLKNLEDIHPVETSVKEVNDIIEVMCSTSTSLKSYGQQQAVLLRELNHRVKNSLQTVAAVIRLQTSNSHPSHRNDLNEAALRVNAIAKAHQHLYNASDASVSTEYLGGILEDMCQNLPVQFDNDIDVVPLCIDFAVPLSLLVNEVVSNAIKNGTLDQEDGRYAHIKVIFSRSEDKERWSLIVRDQGTGFPLNFGEKHFRSLGMKLIKNLVSQLEARISFTNAEDGGGVVTVTGPIHPSHTQR